MRRFPPPPPPMSTSDDDDANENGNNDDGRHDGNDDEEDAEDFDLDYESDILYNVIRAHVMKLQEGTTNIKP